MSYNLLPLFENYRQAYHAAAPSASHIPVHGGIAVAVKIPDKPNTWYTGTLSGIAIDKSSGKKYLLSNQHVFFPYQSGSTKIKPGLSVVNPGQPSKIIAKTKITKSEKNPWPDTTAGRAQAMDTIGTYHDSALADPLVAISAEVNNIGKQRSMVEPKVGMRIKFYGRTSRLQRGVISKINQTVFLNPANGKITLKKNLIFADIQSQPGDSGSMIFTEDNHVVGVLYGSGTSGVVKGNTLIAKASAIANAYNVVFSEDEAPKPKPEPTPKPEPEPSPKPGPDIQAFLKQQVEIGGIKMPMLMVISGGVFGVFVLLALSAAAGD